MRALILTLMLMIFTAQSLALAVAPACDHQGAGPQGAHGAEMLSTHDHAGAGMTAGDHSDMPCCQDTPESAGDALCQLTCAAGGCGAVALLASEWQLSPAPAIPAFLPISPSPLTASQRNLLRPPIGA